MSKAMRLDLRVTGIASANRGAEAIERVSKAVKELNKVTGGQGAVNILMGGGRGGSGSGGAARLSSGGSNLSKLTSYYSSNASSNPQAALDFANTMLVGNPLNGSLIGLKNRAQAVMSRQANAQAAAQQKYQDALDRAQKNAGGGGASFSKRLQNFAYSTRFGSGAMPLVGRTLDLLGLGRLAGPIGIVVAALGAFKFALDESVKGTMQFNAIRYGGGATPQQVKAAQQIADFSGVSPEEYANRARSLQEEYYGGGAAAMDLRRLGVKAPGYGINRNPNAVGWMNDAVKRALSIKNPRERLRVLQDLGVPNAEIIGGMNPDQFDRTMNAGRNSTEDARRAGVAQDLAWKRMQRNFQKFGINPIAWIQDAADMMNSIGPKNGGKSKTEKQLESIDNGVWAIVNGQRQTKGNFGPRGQASVPSAWQWFDANDQAVQKQAAALGALGV